jgi:hypothetical protein
MSFEAYLMRAMATVTSAIASGQAWGEYCSERGVDPGLLRSCVGDSFADEPFDQLHELQGIEEGALRNIGLSRAQREAVAGEIRSGSEAAFMMGVEFERVRKIQ